MFSKNLVLVVLISTAFAEEALKSDRDDFKKSLDKDCATSYSLTCLKLDVVTWVDKLDETDEYSVLPGVSVVRENGNTSGARANNDMVAEISRQFPNDPETRVDAFLLKKIAGYLATHSLKLNLWDKNNDVEARGGGEGGGGGGGKKGGGGMMGIFAMGAMMKATLAAIALKGIALIAAKALMTALISLVISAIIGLKSLTHKGGHTTYEVVSKPIYTHSNTHSVSHEEHGGGHYGHSSYGRSFDMPLPLGLQEGYKPPQ